MATSKTLSKPKAEAQTVTAASASSTDKSTKGRRIVRTKQDTARLATVPDLSYAEGYVKRKLANGLSDFIMYDYALNNHDNVLVEGPTGCGKTSSIMAWAAERGHPFYSISSSIGIEPSQLYGRWIPDSTGGIVWQDGPVTDLVRHGGVLLINEVNFIPDRVGTVLFSLLDKRREIQLVDHKGEIVRAHDNLVIFADMNPDYSGTHPLNAAFRNRFSIQLYWDYDVRIESKLVPYTSLIDLAKQLRDRVKTGEFETPVSTNMLFEFVRNYEFLGMDFAVINFMNHFNADEREALKLVMGTHSAEIAKDLSKIERLTPYGEVANTKKDGEYGVNWGYPDDAEDPEVMTEVDPDYEFGDDEGDTL